jgi:hypothetical protein
MLGSRIFFLTSNSPSVLVSHHHRSRTRPSRAHACSPRSTRCGQRQKPTKRTHPRPRRKRKETRSSQTKRLAKHSLQQRADQHSPTPSVPPTKPAASAAAAAVPSPGRHWAANARRPRLVRLASGSCSYHP